MNYGKTLLTLLAIFCLIASAGMVCAADQDGYAGINYHDANGFCGSQYGLYETLEPGNGLPLENQTGYVPVDANGNPINNATGNATAPTVHNTTNTTTPTVHNTTNTTGNTTNSTTTHTLPATGNPILAILAVTAIIGSYAVIRRKD